MKTKLTLIILLFFAGFSCKKEATRTPEIVYIKGGEIYEFTAPYNAKKVIWNFGDGHTSTELHPKYSYSTPGKYIVTVSIYKRAKFIKKLNKYLVEVSQLYRPRIKSIGSSSRGDSDNYLNYLYKDFDAYFKINITDDLDPEDFSFNAIYNNIELDTTEYYNNEFLPINTPDTGYYNASFTIFDKNNVSSTIDTTYFVGNHETSLQLQIPDQHLAQLGTIYQKRLLYYYEFAKYDYRLQAKTNILNYNGPSTGNLFTVNSSSEIYINSGNGSSWFDGDKFRGIAVKGLFIPSDNSIIKILVPAHEDIEEYKPEDYDQIYFMIVITGSNGISFGEASMTVLPGSLTDLKIIDLTFYPY